MIQFDILPDQPIYENRHIDGLDGLTVSSKLHKCSIVGTGNKIIPGLELGRTLGDLVEPEIGLQAQDHTGFIFFLDGDAWAHRDAQPAWILLKRF